MIKRRKTGRRSSVGRLLLIFDDSTLSKGFETQRSKWHMRSQSECRPKQRSGADLAWPIGGLGELRKD